MILLEQNEKLFEAYKSSLLIYFYLFEGEREISPYAGSLSKCLQQSRLRQSKAKNLELSLCLPCEW